MRISKNKKNTSFLIVEKLISVAVAFLAGVYIARVAGPTVFGEYSYVLSFVSLFSPLCVMGLNNITTQHVLRFPKHEHLFLSLVTAIRFCGALLSLVVGALIVLVFIDEKSISLSISELLFLQCFQLFYAIEYFFLAKNNVVLPGVVRILALFISSFLKLLCVYFDAGVSMLVLSHGITYLLTAVGYLIIYFKFSSFNKNKPSFKTRDIKMAVALFHKGKWLLLSGFAAIIYLKIDQIMLGYFQSVEDVAFYAAAARLSEFWYMFPIIIANVYSAHIFNLHRQSKAKFERFILYFLSLLALSAIGISFIVYLGSDLIIDLIFGAQFEQSATILSIHIFATLFVFQRAVFSKWLIANQLYKYSLFTQGFGAFANVLLNLYFIPKWGTTGAAWATLISYMIASYISLFFSSNTRPFALLMTKAMMLSPYIIHQTKFRATMKHEPSKN